MTLQPAQKFFEMLLFGYTDNSRDKSQAQAATTWGGGDPGSLLANMTYNKP